MSTSQESPKNTEQHSVNTSGIPAGVPISPVTVSELSKLLRPDCVAEADAEYRRADAKLLLASAKAEELRAQKEAISNERTITVNSEVKADAAVRTDSKVVEARTQTLRVIETKNLLNAKAQLLDSQSSEKSRALERELEEKYDAFRKETSHTQAMEKEKSHRQSLLNRAKADKLRQTAREEIALEEARRCAAHLKEDQKVRCENEERDRRVRAQNKKIFLKNSVKTKISMEVNHLEYLQYKAEVNEAQLKRSQKILRKEYEVRALRLENERLTSEENFSKNLLAAQQGDSELLEMQRFKIEQLRRELSSFGEEDEK